MTREELEQELAALSNDYYYEEEEAMTDQELCGEINANLRPGWEAFSPLGDGVSAQGYLTAGDYGVMGNEGGWRVVFADDAEPASRTSLAGREHAMKAAEALSND